jgi:hypothetical protein
MAHKWSLLAAYAAIHAMIPFLDHLLPDLNTAMIITTV